MFSLAQYQHAIREERLDGWLFCNFHHRDRITDDLLGLDESSLSSRRWFYWVPSSGNPVKIVHTIESGSLDALPGEREIYTGFDDLCERLRAFSGKKIAMLSDPRLAVLSTVDAATADLVKSFGIETTSAASLVQRIASVLSPEGIASHEKAAAALYAIIHKAWDFVRRAFAEGIVITEGDILDMIADEFSREGLVTDHPPIIATAENAGNPHYAVPGTAGTPGRGRKIERDAVLQFDIWAKYPGGIFADISWVAWTGATAPTVVADRANAVFAARDAVVRAAMTAFSTGKKITGAELDSVAREVLLSRVPRGAIRHRTGHGIDVNCHGSGVNLDSVEFPDGRFLIEGSCFSIEPGAYFDDSGFRTEIDMYINNGIPTVSGGPIQRELLTL